MSEVIFPLHGSVTVRDILSFAEKKLTAAGVEHPSLDAGWIVSHVLGIGRLELPMVSAHTLHANENERIAELIERRSTREPLQYVLGNTFFAELELRLDQRVFIPRPETEEFLQRIFDEIEIPPRRFLDLGVGSGAIVLGLARLFPKAEAFAVDQSSDCLCLAEENAKHNDLQERVHFLRSDWFERVNGQFDLIVSNPPYLDQKEWQACESEVRDFEPKKALVSELRDSASDLKRIVTDGFSRLRPAGLLALETGESHHALLIELALQSGYLAPRGFDDLHGRPRYFFASKPA